MIDYFTKAYKKPLIKRITDLIELSRFQKFCEENPINADMSYLERLHEVFN